MTKEVMKQALKALTNCTDYDNQGNPLEKKDVVNDLAIKVLIEALKQSKPLTSEQIDEIYFDSTLDIDRQYNQLYAFARAIESAHGIKE